MKHYNLDQWCNKSLRLLIKNLDDTGAKYYCPITKEYGFFISNYAKGILNGRKRWQTKKK